MRVLSLSQLFMPDSVGGTGRIARQLAESMIERGASVTVATQRLSDHTPRREVTGELSIYRYGSPRLRKIVGLTPSAMLGAQLSLRRVLRTERFDAVISHQPAAAVAVRDLLNRYGLAELRMFHASSALERDRGLSPHGPRHLETLYRKARLGGLASSATWRLERNYLMTASHICYLSHFSERLARELHGTGLPPSTVIPAGIDTRVFVPATDRQHVRRRLGVDSESNLVFTARNLGPRMGLEHLVRAIARIAKTRHSIRLVIAGDGVLKEQLTRLVRELGLEQIVTLAGRVRDDQLIEWYQAADLFVLPTTELEGFGMVAIEALSCGTPVLGTPVGAIPEVLRPDGGGFLSEGTTADDLATAVEHLLNRDLSAIRTEARAAATANFDVRLQASRVLELLQALIDERGSRPTETARTAGHDRFRGG